jgi:hypothetical protein
MRHHKDKGSRAAACLMPVHPDQYLDRLFNR